MVLRLLPALVWMFLSVPVPAAEPGLLLGPSPEKIEANGLPSGWQELHFQGIEVPTQYTLNLEDNRYALKAVSQASASGLFTEVNVEPETYQQISWEWKIENVLEKGDATQKSGDDFSARVIVAFQYDPEDAPIFKWIKYELARLLYGRYPPDSALIYVWGNRLPIGTTLEAAYTSWAKVIVLESGSSKAGQWVSEQRNFYKDYLRVFRAQPPRLRFVGIMTDTDDTEEQAVAYYRQLRLGK